MRPMTVQRTKNSLNAFVVLLRHLTRALDYENTGTSVNGTAACVGVPRRSSSAHPTKRQDIREIYRACRSKAHLAVLSAQLLACFGRVRTSANGGLPSCFTAPNHLPPILPRRRIGLLGYSHLTDQREACGIVPYFGRAACHNGTSGGQRLVWRPIPFVTRGRVGETFGYNVSRPKET